MKVALTVLLWGAALLVLVGAIMLIVCSVSVLHDFIADYRKRRAKQ